MHLNFVHNFQEMGVFLKNYTLKCIPYICKRKSQNKTHKKISKLSNVSEIFDILILFSVGLFSFFAFQIDYTVPTVIAEEMSYML